MKLSYKDSEKWLSDNGYQKNPRYTYDKYGGTYVHKESKEEVNVQHYPKAGVSHIDKIDKEGNMKIESVISDMIVRHLTEGTRGDTGLVNPDGTLTHQGQSAAYEWRLAGHRGTHPSISMERRLKRKRIVKDV